MGAGKSVQNQQNPTILGHEEAEVEFVWRGVPHLKSSRSRTYWFDRQGNFQNHKARMEAESIMKEIKSDSGINDQGCCCCGENYGYQSNILEIESFFKKNGKSFEQRMGKHGYSIDWELIERGIGKSVKVSGRRRTKIRRYPHAWIFFYNTTGRNNSDRLSGRFGEANLQRNQNMQPVAHQQMPQMQMNMQTMNPVGGQQMVPQQMTPQQMQAYQQQQMMMQQQFMMMHQNAQINQVYPMQPQPVMGQNPQMMMQQAQMMNQPQAK